MSRRPTARRSRPGPGPVPGVLAALALALPAAAQNNSLLGRRAGPGPGLRPAPASQPAAGALQAPRAGGAVQAAAAAASPLAAPRHDRPNAVLLATSPVAVAAPAPETIEVHRLITIIVRESKTATSDAKLESKKDWKHEWSLDDWIRYSDEHGLVPAELPAGKPAVTFEYKNDYNGDGKYDRRDELTTRITAEVIDVKPNGNLVLAARKRITIDDEGYTITLTGVCRSSDVTPQNTILSTQIAEPEIQVRHSGAVRDATRRGWLMRGLDFLNPF